MTDTCARAYPAKARIGDQSNGLSVRQVTQRGRKLIGFLHARAHGTAANQSNDIASFDRILTQAFNGSDRLPLTGEYACRPRFSIDSIRINLACIDGSAFDNSSLGSEIPGKKCDRAGETALARRRGIHNDVPGVDPIENFESFTQFL